MRGLWGLKFYQFWKGRHGEIFIGWHKSQNTKMAAFLDRIVIISASILLKKAWLGSKLGDSGPRNPFMWILMQGLKIQDG